MEKEKILSALIEKLGKTSFSQKTLETYVDKHLPSEGTEPDDAYWALHTEILKTLEGQYNHDVAVAVEEAKKNIATPQNPDPKTDPVADDAITKRLEALEKALADEKKKSSVDMLRNTVLGKGDELKVSNKPLWNDVVKMVEVTDGMDDSQMTETAKKLYEERLKSYFGEGAAPYGGGKTVSPDNKEYEKELDDFFSRKAQEGKFPEKK
mgnify:CR=1 FL=1|jgi:hypothetical protein